MSEHEPACRKRGLRGSPGRKRGEAERDRRLVDDARDESETRRTIGLDRRGPTCASCASRGAARRSRRVRRRPCVGVGSQRVVVATAREQAHRRRSEGGEREPDEAGQDEARTLHSLPW